MQNDNTIDWDSAKPSHEDGFLKGGEGNGRGKNSITPTLLLSEKYYLPE